MERILEQVQRYKHHNEHLNENLNYFDNTIEIYNFSLLMHLYTYMIYHMLGYNPFQVMILLTFLYSFFKYFCNYSLSSFVLHPIWYKRFYNIALPQLLTSVNNVMILNKEYSLITSTVQTGCVFLALNYNFDNVELSKSNNIRGIITFVIILIKYMISLW